MEIGDIWELVINQRETGDFQNRHVFVVNANIPTWHADTYAEWASTCLPLFKARRNSSWDMREVIWRELKPGTAGDVDTGNSFEDGAIIGNAWPQQNCAKILWRTGFPGKSFKGSSFFSGYSAVDQVGPFISNALGLVLQAYGQAMIATFGLAGSFQGVAQFGVLSRQLNLTPLDPPILTPCVSFEVQDSIRVQRRRRDA